MTHYGAWEIGTDDTPHRLASDREFLEKHLEGWIERDPSLLGGDVRWVSRQLTLPDGSRLDLLGLTQDNTWVVVELKAGSVGTATVLQALHYFLQIAAMSNAELARRVRRHGMSDASLSVALDELETEDDGGERDYRLLVAGVGGGESAEVAAALLKRHGFDVRIQVVTFSLLRAADGGRILIREVDEELPVAVDGTRKWTLEGVLGLAERHGVREGFDRIRRELSERGYRPYLKKNGLNFNLGSRLQIFWVTPREGMIHMGFLESNFPALFGIEEAEALAELGPNWIDLPPEEAYARIVAWADTIARFQARMAGEEEVDVA